MQNTPKHTKQQMHVVLLSLFLICTLFLSACSGKATNNNSSPNLADAYPSPAGTTSVPGTVTPGATATATPRPTPTLIPSPTVSPALKHQGSTQLKTFKDWINLMKKYGGNVSTYQQQYANDSQALAVASTPTAYQIALNRLNRHITAIQIPALKTEAVSLQKKLKQGAKDWASKHAYKDSYNGKTYGYGYEYGENGIASWPAQDLLDGAQTVADYQYAVDQLNIWVNNFSAYKTNFGSGVAYNRVHATDIQLMQKYGDMGTKTIVISLSEQAVRVYQNGKLVRAFLVVTGMPGHPSLPGSWWVETHDKNLTFKSGLKPGQPGYYPPTPIAYALQYHSSGYYLHESWWRGQYGPGNQFPHNDPNGTAFAFEGSHGCVNISTANIKWLYNFAAVNSTKIIIY